ncbi:MAG TPA: hypothetical protein DCS97_15170, partial [Planctomycetes bacterium]|nr:hypothetical protein [Planctomycetota bacterium]
MPFLALLLFSGVPAVAADLGAIWCIGDSITQSNADGDPNGSPRKSLKALLLTNGYTFSYTGDRTTTNDDGMYDGSFANAIDNLYQFHSGISGSTIGANAHGRTNITAGVPTFWTSGRLAVVKPNIILIMLGTNDVDLNDDLAHAPARMGTLIDTIYGQRSVSDPDPTVFVAQIVPNRRHLETHTAAVSAFNAALPAVVAAQQNIGRKVHLVDQFTPINNNYAATMMADDLHPNAVGNDTMAQQWFAAIQSVVTPSAPPLAPSALVATANSSSQITLTWTDNASNETGFKLERSPDGSSGWTQIATPAANATSYGDSGLLASTAYYYRLRATNAAGDSSYTATASATTTTAVTPSPIARWRFENNLVAEPPTYNATAVGTVGYTTGAVDTSALILDGQLANYATAPFVINPTSNFTAAAWIKVAAASASTQNLLQQEDGSGNGRGWLYRKAAGNLGCYLGGAET